MKTLKGFQTFQYKLSSKSAQMHCMVQLTIGYGSRKKVMRKGEVTVICPITDDDIRMSIVNGEVLQDIFSCFLG